MKTYVCPSWACSVLTFCLSAKLCVTETESYKLHFQPSDYAGFLAFSQRSSWHDWRMAGKEKLAWGTISDSYVFAVAPGSI